MTGLCGIGLAIYAQCASVVVTDGHPDCVANQVDFCVLLEYLICIIMRY